MDWNMKRVRVRGSFSDFTEQTGFVLFATAQLKGSDLSAQIQKFHNQLSVSSFVFGSS